MTSRRSSHSAAVHGGAIYAVGGYNGDKYLATAERYDPREGRCVLRGHSDSINETKPDIA